MVPDNVTKAKIPITDIEIANAIAYTIRVKLNFEGEIPTDEISRHFDSMSLLILLAELEEQFGIQFTGEEGDLRTLNDAVTIIRCKIERGD
jgi:acyl carrier protein